MIEKRNGQTYRKLYDELVGLEDVDTYELLCSIENWQYYDFIAQCFCYPKVVATADRNDEQFRKFLKGIQSLWNLNKEIDVLDYGAGECRIYDCIQLLQEEGKTLPVSYTAYEPYPSEELLKRVSNQEKTSKGLTLIQKIRDIALDRKYDIVVMMNVLHEISVSEWERTFYYIYQCMSANGMLMLLEVHSLSNGEQPFGKNGYLLLHDKEVKVLFRDEEIINITLDDHDKSNCWMIRKDSLRNITRRSISDSIHLLKDNCENKLRTEYYKRIDLANVNGIDQEKRRSARVYAFLTQQYINAYFALEEMQNSKGENKDKTLEEMKSKKPERTEKSPEETGHILVKKIIED